MNLVLVALALAATTLRCPAATTDIGITLNPVVSGTHESFDDREHVPPIPVPLIEVRHNSGPLEIDAEALPPVASVRAFDPIQGHTSTQLAIVEGFARVWDPLRRYSLGIGQILYNQSTHYADPIEIAGTGETQFSRVTGIAYQVGYGIALHHGRLEASFDYAPAMLGTQYTIYNNPRVERRADPERAEQIDTAVRYIRPAGAHAQLAFGLRYVNYTARYDRPSGGLSDRNVGLLAVFGYALRLAR